MKHLPISLLVPQRCTLRGLSQRCAGAYIAALDGGALREHAREHLQDCWQQQCPNWNEPQVSSILYMPIEQLIPTPDCKVQTYKALAGVGSCQGGSHTINPFLRRSSTAVSAQPADMCWGIPGTSRSDGLLGGSHTLELHSEPATDSGTSSCNYFGSECKCLTAALMSVSVDRAVSV